MTFDVIGEYRRSQYQDEVRPLQARHDGGPVGGQKPGEERVALGKAIARRHGADPNRRLVQLRERNGFIPCIVARNRRADHDDGLPRSLERAGGSLEQDGIAGDGPADVTRLDRHARTVPVVDRNRYERGAARRLHRDIVSARYRRGHVRGARGFDAPFDVRFRQLSCLFRI